MQINRLKGHAPYILAIILLGVLVFHRPFNLTDLSSDDKVTFYFPRGEIIKQSAAKYGDFMPLWNPYIMSGTPFFGYPTVGIDYILGVLALVMPTVAALKLNYLFDIIFAGIAMYLLMISLKKEAKFAFIAALVFMFNGYAMMVFRDGMLTSINAYAFMPLALLFVIKAFKSKDWVKHAVISGVVFAIQLRAGPDLKVLLFTGLMAGLYFAFSLIGRHFTKRAAKALLIGIVLFAVFFGLSAQKIVPVKEYLDKSSRGETPWESASGRSVGIGRMAGVLIEPRLQGKSEGLNIGIIAFLLAGFCIYKKRKNKLVLFISTAALIAVLVAMGSFVFYLLWKYVPGFSGFRYVNRALVLYVFCGSILAGIGAEALFSEMDKRKVGNKKKNIAYFSLAALILANLVIFGTNPIVAEQSDANEAIKNNHVLQHISKMPGIFRIQTYETRGIDWGTEFYNVPLGLEHIYGYETAWYPPYFNAYLGIANRDPAKFWGILNVKYLTAVEEINLTGFRLVKKFEECNACWPGQPNLKKAYGPYLYENEGFLPRAYLADSGVLVVGDEDAATQMIYGLMADGNFNPANTVIIRGKKSINDYNINELRKFNAVALTTGSIDQNSLNILKNYADNGGILLPNVVNNENSITAERLQEMWNSFKGGLNAIDDKDVAMHDFDNREIKLNGRHSKKFLVYSEKFSVFPGWTAKADGKNVEMHNADSMISAVYLDSNYDRIIFEYKPKSYRNGSIITLIAILLVTGYFAYRRIKQKK